MRELRRDDLASGEATERQTNLSQGHTESDAGSVHAQKDGLTAGVPKFRADLPDEQVLQEA